jgi:hypothetical protein
MVTLCWAAKGGSGTTVVAATLALHASVPTLLVDLDGELPTVLGLPESDRPGVGDWLASDAPAAHLDDLLLTVDDHTSLLPWRGGGVVAGGADASGVGTDPDRQRQLVDWLVAWGPAHIGSSSRRSGGRGRTHRRRPSARSFRREIGGSAPAPDARPAQVIVDAGTGEPWSELACACERRLLVTRRCYLALRRAGRMVAEPTGVIVVDEAGRSLSNRDIEASLGTEVVASISVDPSVARAVDAGLLTVRLPSIMRRELNDAAA